MRYGWFFLSVIAIVITFLMGNAILYEQGYAAKEQTHRQTQLTVSYTEFEWWLLRWSDNELTCQLYIEHEGLPTGAEVFKYCGHEKYNEWMASGPCLALDNNGGTTTCPGLYAHFITSEGKQKKITVDLPLPTVWVTLSGCTQKPLDNHCQQMPSLLLIAEEPLPNEQAVAIHGIMGGRRFSCPASTCLVPLRKTTNKGAVIDFWMDSSYGDSSDHFQVKVRILDSATVEDGKQKTGYYVDLLSSQWRGLEPINGCSECWQAFPSAGASISWLANPQEKDQLISNEPFVYLAGRMILANLVDAKDCPNQGLFMNGWANACGLEKARAGVKDWQNRFNQEILLAAKENGVPSQLLKNVLAQETQFWPAAVLDMEINEYGFGRQTELGSDVLLLYNESFYQQFCPLVLDQSTCDSGYVFLSQDHQSILRGALALSTSMDCPSCASGINLSRADLSIRMVAQMLQANCRQTGAMITTVSGKSPGDTASYEDLWKFTLTSYHAGAGCFLDSFITTWNLQEPLTWQQISTHLEPGCQTALQFVERVIKPSIFFADTLPEIQFLTPDTFVSTVTATAEASSPTPEVTSEGNTTPVIQPTPTFEPTSTITPLPTVTFTPSPTATNIPAAAFQSIFPSATP